MVKNATYAIFTGEDPRSEDPMKYVKILFKQLRTHIQIMKLLLIGEKQFKKQSIWPVIKI